jgi:pimeloyl-ACP methyl ester carboxylesterase
VLLRTHIPFKDYSGRGPLLHFAHANGYPPGSYRQLFQLLADDHHVLAMCQRPLWNGSLPEELDSWHLMADDLIDFFDQQGISGAIGIGHSMGAVSTMAAALKRPQLFRALVLIEPVFLSPAAIGALARHRALEGMDDFPLVKVTLNRQNQWSDRQSAFQHFRRKVVFDRLSDEALWDYVEYGLRENDRGYLELAYPREWEARIYATFPADIWELAPQITQPTLAMRGAESDTLGEEAWGVWQEAQPQATFMLYQESGHLLPMEKPGPVSEGIGAFLKSLE